MFFGHNFKYCIQHWTWFLKMMILLSYDRFLWIFSLSGSLLKHRRGELGFTHLPNLQIQPENVYFYLFSITLHQKCFNFTYFLTFCNCVPRTCNWYSFRFATNFLTFNSFEGNAQNYAKQNLKKVFLSAINLFKQESYQNIERLHSFLQRWKVWLKRKCKEASIKTCLWQFSLHLI